MVIILWLVHNYEVLRITYSSAHLLRCVNFRVASPVAFYSVIALINTIAFKSVYQGMVLHPLLLQGVLFIFICPKMIQLHPFHLSIHDQLLHFNFISNFMYFNIYLYFNIWFILMHFCFFFVWFIWVLSCHHFPTSSFSSYFIWLRSVTGNAPGQQFHLCMPPVSYRQSFNPWFFIAIKFKCINFWPPWCLNSFYQGVQKCSKMKAFRFLFTILWNHRYFYLL